jgi:hypothetical protein
MTGKEVQEIFSLDRNSINTAIRLTQIEDHNAETYDEIAKELLFKRFAYSREVICKLHEHQLWSAENSIGQGLSMFLLKGETPSAVALQEAFRAHAQAEDVFKQREEAITGKYIEQYPE